jgi:hypothetical protein
MAKTSSHGSISFGEYHTLVVVGETLWWLAALPLWRGAVLPPLLLIRHLASRTGEDMVVYDNCCWRESTDF